MSTYNTVSTKRLAKIKRKLLKAIKRGKFGNINIRRRRGEGGINEEIRAYSKQRYGHMVGNHTVQKLLAIVKSNIDRDLHKALYDAGLTNATFAKTIRTVYNTSVATLPKSQS